MPDHILVIAPHPDDEAIGCGGALCLHHDRGDHTHVVFLTSGERGLAGLAPEAAWAVREAEAQHAAAVLGASRLDFLRLPDLGLTDHVTLAAERLRPILTAHPPDVIYVPHPAESHPDHEAALRIVVAARGLLGPTMPPAELYGYEVWSPLSRHGWVEDISAVMSRKLRAIRCYRSQLAEFRYDRAVRGLNRYRGILHAAGRYAEAYVSLNSSPPAVGG